MQRLRQLILDRTTVNEAGVLSLTALKSLKVLSLRKLYIRMNDVVVPRGKIQKEVREELARALPDCTIYE